MTNNYFCNPWYLEPSHLTRLTADLRIKRKSRGYFDTFMSNMTVSGVSSEYQPTSGHLYTNKKLMTMLGVILI